MKGKNADVVIHNAVIYSMNGNFEKFDAMAIKDGKVLELGAERQILNRYSAEEYIDAKGKEVLPALSDAHGHMLIYARMKLSANLFGATSMEEIMVRIEKHFQKNNQPFLYGRGWDQTLWNATELPSNELLNVKFPTIPVVLHRIDGHAVLANDCALKMAGITKDTKIFGGEITSVNGKMTGILKENAITYLTERLPDFAANKLIEKLDEVQNELLQYGILTVHEAGISNKDLKMLLALNEKKKLKVNIYGMLYPEAENIAWAKKNGIYKKGKLHIRSFKVMLDGALGSYGALLKKKYNDHEGMGIFCFAPEQVKKLISIALDLSYQVNFHAIGDSTNHFVLQQMESVFKIKPDHRFRIEHAQVVDPKDIPLFGKYGVIPSVQPVHLSSDHKWAASRIGNERLKGSYAYKSLLNSTGVIAIGTDFPVEFINPYGTIKAAIERTNLDNSPIGGFMPDEALSLKECLMGMTFWSSLASFTEISKGTLEKGKDADFVIFDQTLTKENRYKAAFSYLLYDKGKVVYSME